MHALENPWRVSTGKKEGMKGSSDGASRQRKNGVKSVRHPPAECGNYPPFAQRDDRCTHRGLVWDPSASLVKINPGGLSSEGRRLEAPCPSWTAGVLNVWLDQRAHDGLWFLTRGTHISRRWQVSHTGEYRVSTCRLFFFSLPKALDARTRELVCRFRWLASSEKYKKSSGDMSVIKDF